VKQEHSPGETDANSRGSRVAGDGPDGRSGLPLVGPGTPARVHAFADWTMRSM
jgi:hypothetical protein